MRQPILAVLLLAAALPAAAAGFGATQAGTSGAPFLKLGADARAAGMGGAVRAAVDDATAIYWNPAGLAGLRYRHATMTHGASYQGTFQDFIAYAQPVESPFGRQTGRERDLRPDQLGTLGVAVLYQNSGSLSEIDNTATATGDRFTPQDLAVFLAWGATVSRGLDVGVGLKYVTSKIQGTASTGAVDLGARWRTWLPGEFPYALSLSAQNLGGQLKFREAGDPLPMLVTVGQALRVVKGLVVTLDLNAPRDRSLYPSFGLEWRVPMKQGLSAALRGGYDGRLKSTDSGGLTGVSFGGGLGVQRFGFDYGWSPAGGLGSTHKLSLSYRF
ncbi:MAG: PorV/PorQ family protein [Elusimicrobia bacterium]|nr:PorV/PorQ family protein [Elusimicrobiota bacterium]